MPDRGFSESSTQRHGCRRAAGGLRSQLASAFGTRRSDVPGRPGEGLRGRTAPARDPSAEDVEGGIPHGTLDGGLQASAATLDAPGRAAARHAFRASNIVSSTATGWSVLTEGRNDDDSADIFPKGQAFS